jgi:hypothetical protein
LIRSVNVAERFYSGEPGGRVTVRESSIVGGIENKHPLTASFDHPNHSSVGFAWGNDSGPRSANLARALLFDALGDYDSALRLADEFRSRAVSIFPARWTITRSRILAHAQAIEFKQNHILLGHDRMPIGLSSADQPSST